MLRIAICHSNKELVHFFSGAIQKMDATKSCIVFSYYNIEDVIKDLSISHTVDLMMIETELAMFNNQKILEILRLRMPSCVLVLIQKDGMVDASLLKEKPYRCLCEREVSVDNYHALQDSVIYAKIMQKKTFLWGMSNKISYKIWPEDILYVSIAKRGSVIHINPGAQIAKTALEFRSMAKLAELFDTVGGCGFAYAHNSYFINLNYVVRKGNNELELEDGSVLNISRSQTKRFDYEFRNYWNLCYEV